ncbi:Transcription factor jumonji (JmjC) domain-containing protein-like [Zostera marina]|uniref:Transcription factor jumonji (JmjC) domain-containing protein-like n=1 Tax=Zostera marina TaxID=29655 RepID=A0A0K9Q3R5_ZOSMR|nr:Transcription factor jumonji (JmjC) domain-containing protein-like [Zostera marina]
MDDQVGEGSPVERSLLLKSFDTIPSPEKFSSEIERFNVPAVFRGAVKDWDAVSKWDPLNGGLDYFQEKVGSNVVEAMLSSSAPVFYGDLRSHERVPLSFSIFIDSCKSCRDRHCGVSGDVSRNPSEMGTIIIKDEGSTSPAINSSDQVYLAQVPILDVEDKDRSALPILQEDIEIPSFLKSKSLSSINLWMNSTRSRSSTHYDPYHNILCVVAGCKQVSLWPPSASPMLYPMAVYGEASNHSAVNLEGPNLVLHPRAKHSLDISQKIFLLAGDALFIPEGWFHQVDSSDLTVAVNFWWQSYIMSNIMEHMDAYYMRCILNRLTGKEKDQMLLKIQIDNSKAKENHLSINRILEGDSSSSFSGDGSSSSNSTTTLSTEDIKENAQIPLDDLQPFVLKALNELISFVHRNVNLNENLSTKQTTVKDEPEGFQTAEANLLDDDPVASFLLAIKPLVLKQILLVMVQNFPRTLEAFVLHTLSPIAADILTRKFEEIDKKITKEHQIEFYQQFYSAFDDQFSVMDTLLSRKETFAFQAFKNTLEQYLGITVDQTKFLGGR